MNNLAFYSLLRWNLIILPILTGIMYFLNLWVRGREMLAVYPTVQFSVHIRVRLEFATKRIHGHWVSIRAGYELGSLSTRTGDNDGHISQTITLIPEDKMSTWKCEIDIISGSSCSPVRLQILNFEDVVRTWYHFEKFKDSLFCSKRRWKQWNLGINGRQLSKLSRHTE